jgi:hypothetical protein
VGPLSGGNLRAADADRDQVATVLSTAYAEGRITREEHDERLDQVMRARTFDDLVPITSDLVPLPAATPDPTTAPSMVARTRSRSEESCRRISATVSHRSPGTTAIRTRRHAS